ncbi:hypothetical protein HHK36_031664 [Tetracentron sinense]|uniref:Aspergillus nuclease S1 n=1 Tax=Tetracentron sinense TaxID=13715 RepID=A0A834Y8S3_TETSI|nr:hypothetical protein HHK36_031664 [Tetracentron sinense]
MFLYYQEKMNVLVEPDVHDIFARIPGFGFVQTFYSQDTSDLHERVDFVACLGGDGVILHASNIFRGAVPPVVSFNLGSLGFLTTHTFEDYRQDLRQVVRGNNTLDGVYITLRMCLRCEIFRNGKAMPGKVFDVLNEVVVDRGSNPYLSKIECYEHDRLITKVQGDGVIVATPTGSTAYSTAAGGSMQRLSEAAANTVKKLLPDYADNDLGSLCSWADHVKFRYHWSSALHYIDTPDSLCTYQYNRDCKDENGEKDRCVAGAINNYTTQLLSYGAASSQAECKALY